MKTILEGRWEEIISCIAGNAALAATVMMGGLLEGIILAKIERQTNKAPAFTSLGMTILLLVGI